MKALAVILNIFFPGVGSLVLGKVGQGIAQLILYILGVVLSFTVIGAIIGVPLCIAMWIWGIVTATSANLQPLQVHVIHTTQPPAQS